MRLLLQLIQRITINRQSSIIKVADNGMRRRHVLKSGVKKISQVVPYGVNSFYDERADELNIPPSSLKIYLNKQAVAHRIARLKLTAAQAECAVLTGTQVNQHYKFFVINRLASKQNKWINEAYSQADQYRCFINANITQARMKTVCSEESVSFPFIHADVHRYETIQVQYTDENGSTINQQIKGFQALAFQQAYDYSFSRHILDWRLHHGNIKIQQNVKQRLPKISQVLEEYSREVKNIMRKYPHLFVVPDQVENNHKWLEQRGSPQNLSIEDDYLLRMHKHYRKEMLLLLERMEHGI